MNFFWLSPPTAKRVKYFRVINTSCFLPAQLFSLRCLRGLHASSKNPPWADSMKCIQWVKCLERLNRWLNLKSANGPRKAEKGGKREVSRSLFVYIQIYSAHSSFRVIGRWIWVPELLLASRWIHLSDPLLALPRIIWRLEGFRFYWMGSKFPMSRLQWEQFDFPSLAAGSWSSKLKNHY